MSNRPYAGNTEYSISEAVLNEAALYYSTPGVLGLQSILTFTDGDYEISPTQWEVADADYDYESVSNVLLHKVNKWRPYWKIKQKYADKDNWMRVRRLIMSLMNRTGHVFSSTGVSRTVRFWFYPPGDSYRPRVEVVLATRNTEMDEYLGNRYIGFGDFELIIRGSKIYDEQNIASRFIGTFDVSTAIVSPAGSAYTGDGVSS